VLDHGGGTEILQPRANGRPAPRRTWARKR